MFVCACFVFVLFVFCLFSAAVSLQGNLTFNCCAEVPLPDVRVLRMEGDEETDVCTDKKKENLGFTCYILRCNAYLTPHKKTAVMHIIATVSQPVGSHFVRMDDQGLNNYYNWWRRIICLFYYFHSLVTYSVVNTQMWGLMTQYTFILELEELVDESDCYLDRYCNTLERYLFHVPCDNVSYTVYMSETPFLMSW